jgi:hypothetical protein
MTNPTQWISAALKILSIWLLVGATTRLPMFAGYVAMELYSSTDDPIARAGRWGGIGSLIGQLTTIAIAIVMWRRSGGLGRLRGG